MLEAAELKGFGLFWGLDSSDLARVAKLCERRKCLTNTEIFTINKPANHIYLLEGPSDAIRIEIQIHEHGPKSVVHSIKKGEAFGWASLVPPHLRTASARCVEDADLICIDGKALIELIEKNNHIGYVLMKNLAGLLSSRLSETTVALRHEVRQIQKVKSQV